MSVRPQELTLIFCRERPGCRWDDTAILECEEPAAAEDLKVLAEKTIHGDLNGLLDGRKSVIVKASDCPPEDLTEGLSYRFYGRWSDHERHGRQFVAQSYVRVQPHGRTGVIRYLKITCAGHGVGQATAHKLWERFGGDAVRVLRESPDVAAAGVDLRHFTSEVAAEASAALKAESGREAVNIALTDLLGGRGFPRDTPKRCVAEAGNRAAEFVRRSPYWLMRFKGCSFSRTDQLYIDLGGDPTAIKRQAYCARDLIVRNGKGHTWHEDRVIDSGLRGRISGTTADLFQAVRLGKRAGLLALRPHERDENRVWIAERGAAENEATIAEHVRDMLRAPVHWPDVSALNVSEHQRTELNKALAGSIGIFGGSPGTGKTRTAAHLIGRVIELCGAENVAVCAPTGKAAVRISEALAGYGIKKTASTIHRLLGVAGRSEGEGWGFTHNEENPLPQKFFILDEGSMPDTDIFAALVRALPRAPIS